MEETKIENKRTEEIKAGKDKDPFLREGSLDAFLDRLARTWGEGPVLAWAASRTSELLPAFFPEGRTARGEDSHLAQMAGALAAIRFLCHREGHSPADLEAALDRVWGEWEGRLLALPMAWCIGGPGYVWYGPNDSDRFGPDLERAWKFCSEEHANVTRYAYGVAGYGLYHTTVPVLSGRKDVRPLSPVQMVDFLEAHPEAWERIFGLQCACDGTWYVIRTFQYGNGWLKESVHYPEDGDLSLLDGPLPVPADASMENRTRNPRYKVYDLARNGFLPLYTDSLPLAVDTCGSSGRILAYWLGEVSCGGQGGM